MAWQQDWSGLPMVGPTAAMRGLRVVPEAPVREPYDCPTASFDGSLRDPRRLVFLYQQRIRAALLTEVAEEAARPSPFRRALDACRDALGTCEDGLRWLWLAEPRDAARIRSAAASRPVAKPRLWVVPSEGADARPARTSA